MSITHIQETSCYCCQCKKDILLGRVEVRDGAEFCKYNPQYFDWHSFTLNDQIHYLCPKHTLDIHIVVDGKPYKE